MLMIVFGSEKNETAGVELSKQQAEDPVIRLDDRVKEVDLLASHTLDHALVRISGSDTSLTYTRSNLW